MAFSHTSVGKIRTPQITNRQSGLIRAGGCFVEKHSCISRNKGLPARSVTPCHLKCSPSVKINQRGCLNATGRADAVKLEEFVEESGKNSVENAKIWKTVRLCAGLCLSLGLYGMLGGAGGRFASVAAGVTAQKGIGVAAQGAWAGLSAGCLHTLAGPDHLAGLTPLTLGQHRFVAAGMGALWGFGHSSGQLILGLAFILLKERFQGLVPFLSKWAGTVVGLTLITIGIIGIYESLHEGHEDEGGQMQMAGAGGGEGGLVRVSPVKKGLGTYMMGFMYGLHPDALFIVLPALALPTRLAAFSYISMFVIGTVLAMGGYSLVIGTASEAAREKPWLLRNLSTIAGVVAIGVGVVVLLTGFGMDLPVSL